MKHTLSILLVSMFLVSPVKALTVISKVDSPRNCPESLQVKISPLKGMPDQFKVEINFLPEPADTLSIGVFSKLMVRLGDGLLADAPLDVIMDGGQFRSQFRLHLSALEHSKVSVSMYIIGKGGIPIIGGGQVYEISLKGFSMPIESESLTPNVEIPLIEKTPTFPAQGQ